MATQSFNKWVKATVVALALAVPSLSQAAYYNSCDPCNPCDPCPSFCDMDFTFGADFIYWKPCVDELNYAYSVSPVTTGSTTVDTGTYHGVCPQWDPGFRVYLGVPGLCYDFDLTASYTWLYSGDNDSVLVAAPLFISPIRLNPLLGDFTDTWEAADARFSMHYNEWDVLFSYRIACNPCHTFIPHFGVAGIVVNSSFGGSYFHAAGFDDLDFAVWGSRSDYWGVGLRVGSDYEYRFSRCLKAFARAQASLLAGESKNTYATTADITEIGTISFITADDHSCCHMVPGYHIAVGVQYDDKMCDMDVFFRIGYEFLNYWNMPNARTYVGQEGLVSQGLATSGNIRNLGFQGLFVGGGVSF